MFALCKGEARPMPGNRLNPGMARRAAPAGSRVNLSRSGRRDIRKNFEPVFVCWSDVRADLQGARMRFLPLALLVTLPLLAGDLDDRVAQTLKNSVRGPSTAQ